MQYITAEQVADRWAIPVTSVRTKRRRGEIPAINLGTERHPVWRFALTDITRYEQARKVA